MSSECPSGAYINYWQMRTGSLVDRLRGRCSNGSWLGQCGGSGGGFWQGHVSSTGVHIRTGALVDKFNGRGGNGGGATYLSCGSNHIRGYYMRCGSLVDGVKFLCRSY
jgi:hypothetical protein